MFKLLDRHEKRMPTGTSGTAQAPRRKPLGFPNWKRRKYHAQMFYLAALSRPYW